MNAAFLGVPVEFRTTIGSTNDEVLRRGIEGAAQGLVIVSEEQTRGRGRMGRTWWDRPGESLLFSVLLRPKLPMDRLPLLGIAMACAVADAGGEAAGTRLDLKWPNDVLHRGRKLCGVLAEARAAPRSEDGSRSEEGGTLLVLGTGINVSQDVEAFPPEIRARATSLRAVAGGRPIDRDALLAAVLARLEGYRSLAERAGADALLEALKPRLPAPGSPIVVQQGDRRIEGVVEAIAKSGALLLRDPSGARVEVAAGEIPVAGGALT